MFILSDCNVHIAEMFALGVNQTEIQLSEISWCLVSDCQDCGHLFVIKLVLFSPWLDGMHFRPSILCGG